MPKRSRPMKMINRIKTLYRRADLATKIRYSYILLVAPLMVLSGIYLFNIWDSNRTYEQMINAAAQASEFSLDFQKDFDYETYLVVVENKTIEESRLNELLDDAQRVVNSLEDVTTSQSNIAKLSSVNKFISNLRIYVGRISDNLSVGNRYSENLEIWENDVMIVTSLIRETMTQYIYNEITDIQAARIAYQEKYLTVVKYAVVLFVAVFAVLIVLSYVIPRSITKPIRKLVSVTDRIAGGDLSIRSEVIGGPEVTRLNDSMNEMIDKINELIDQVRTEQIHLRKAEFRILQSQINPHFLYNTLDTIVWLAEAGDSKQVVNMVRSLSDFFRTSLNQGKDIVTLKEEIQHVRSYLEIQQVRYQDILTYEIHMQEELSDQLIPKITLQPLVENALYHGIKNKRGGGAIAICVFTENDSLVIRVSDTGIGMNEDRLANVRAGIKDSPSERDVYGLYNVNERIRLNFGEQYGIRLDSSYGEGTVADVILPMRK